jgi:hypothetical protein
MSTMQQIRRNANQAGLGPPVYSGSIAQQIQQNQNYAGLPYTPRAMGGPMDFGNSGVFNAAPGDWNSFNAAVAKMNKDSELKATGNVPSKFGPKPLTMAFIPFGGPAPQRGGGGGGGGGRMGPPSDKKISTVGPRTATDYVNKHGGLSPQRPSMLDAEYAKGNLTNPRVTDWMNNQPPAAAPGGPAPTQMMAGAGAAVGGAFGGLVNDAMPDQKAPTPMAKGGAMHPGKKPYLVGEEGPELIFPRADGSGFVLPHDVTKQVLPAMRDVKPRAQGGPMMAPEVMLERQGDLATMRGFMSPSGSGFAEVQNEPGAEPIMPIDKFFADPSSRYQVDPSRPGMPLMPDAVSGPWAEPGLPVTPEMRQDLQSNTRGNVLGLAGMPDDGSVRTRTVPMSRYPGMTFNDRAVQSMVDYGDALPGETVADFQAKERQYNQALRDPFIGSSKENLSFEEMQQRVAMRGMMYGDDFRDRQARNQTQADLAARAARAPLGTPVLPPTAPGGLPMIPGMERNIERFLRTPQGAAFALQNQMQQQQQLASQQAGNQWQSLTDPTTGRPFAMVNARGQQITLPKMEDDESVIYVDRQVQDPSGLGVVTVREPQIFNKTTGTMRPVGTEGAAAGGGGSPGAAQPNAATDAPSPAKQPVRIQSPEDIKRLGLKPGDPVILPSGKRGVVPKLSKNA